MALQSYDYVKCECCGTPWVEHTDACFNHRNRTARLAGFAAIESSREIAPILANSGQVVPVSRESETKPLVFKVKPSRLFFGLFGKNNRSI